MFLVCSEADTFIISVQISGAIIQSQPYLPSHGDTAPGSRLLLRRRLTRTNGQSGFFRHYRFVPMI
ncbi:hypothetical protein E2C01_077869 [Portunus trituberculatus]|uniref:Uncharacterized protein n=1 Tax=Portunus trituberculatus TaxID=210409 RepID=A0A5B7IH32_PORTR|nr:hypothetical protein [Portunus trituberculatus]